MHIGVHWGSTLVVPGKTAAVHVNW